MPDALAGGGEDRIEDGGACDREGGLWLGTHEHGVCKFNGTKFEKVKF